MTLELDIKECAKTVGQTIDNDTFFQVYEDFDTMIAIIAAANLDAKQATYIMKGSKLNKFSAKDKFKIFKSMNIQFDLSNEEQIKQFLEFIQLAHQTLDLRPLNSIYDLVDSVCTANTDLKQEFQNTQEALIKSNEKMTPIIDSMMNTIRTLESELSKIKFSHDSSSTKKKKLQSKITELNNSITSLKQEISNQNPKISQNLTKDSQILKEANFDKIYSLFEIMLSKGDKDMIKLFCKLGLSEVRNTYQNTPLIQASINGNLGLVQSLIEGGCERDAVNKFENNALLEASSKGRTDVVRYLISAGFDKEWKNKSDGFNAILTASQDGHLETVKLLVSAGCDVNAKQKDNTNSSYYAAWGGHLEVLKFLQSSGCDIKLKADNGNTSLHGAARGNHVAVIEYLNSQGLNINGHGWNGFTPLHQAVNENAVESVEYLIKHGAILNEKDNQNKTPLDIAKSKKLTQIHDFLIDAGAK